LKVLLVRSLISISVLVAVTPAFSATEGQNPETSKQLIVRPSVPPALYKLGPGDEITVQQENAEEINGKSSRIDDLGFVDLPVVGRLKLSGLTLEEAENLLKQELGKLLLKPNPVISIKEYRSQPVSVFGEVNTPGVIQLQGRKTLVEMISMAGGIKTDAGSEVTVTRRLTYGPVPVQGSVTDGSGQFSTARIDIAGLMRGTNPQSNIDIAPQDVITVPKAEVIYVMGSVKKPGGFALSTNGSITVLQALALAEGTTPQAGTKNARIIRANNGDGPKQEIPVNVAAILSNKESDVDLKPKDILVIPDSLPKKIGVRVAEAALQAATGAAIFRAW
jgi:polysaccharide biosynthesis/export protein